MWDPGWDEPPRPPADPSSPAPDDSGWLDESQNPRPGRWYAPTTPRGKLLLILTVTVVLVVTVLACCVGLAGLAKLRSVDSSGLL